MTERRLTFEQLTRSPDDAPEWLGEIVRGIILADHVGDAKDAIIYGVPKEWRQWAMDAMRAEYDEEDDKYVVGE